MKSYDGSNIFLTICAALMLTLTACGSDSGSGACVMTDEGCDICADTCPCPGIPHNAEGDGDGRGHACRAWIACPGDLEEEWCVNPRAYQCEEPDDDPA